MANKKATSKKTSTKVTKKVEAKEVKPVKKVEAVKVVASKSNNKIIETALKPSSLAALTAEFIGTFLLAGVVLASQGAPVSLLFGLVAFVSCLCMSLEEGLHDPHFVS
jgi:glycerol uptake facilitator-like aquaporin